MVDKSSMKNTIVKHIVGFLVLLSLYACSPVPKQIEIVGQPECPPCICECSSLNQ